MFYLGASSPCVSGFTGPGPELASVGSSPLWLQGVVWGRELAAESLVLTGGLQGACPGVPGLQGGTRSLRCPPRERPATVPFPGDGGPIFLHEGRKQHSLDSPTRLCLLISICVFNELGPPGKSSSSLVL